jgi:hypothetical protein
MIPLASWLDPKLSSLPPQPPLCPMLASTVVVPPPSSSLPDMCPPAASKRGRGATNYLGSSIERPDLGIMWVIFDHLRPSGHIMPDHAGDRGAVFTGPGASRSPPYQPDPDVASADGWGQSARAHFTAALLPRYGTDHVRVFPRCSQKLVQDARSSALQHLISRLCRSAEGGVFSGGCGIRTHEDASTP